MFKISFVDWKLTLRLKLHIWSQNLSEKLQNMYPNHMAILLLKEACCTCMSFWHWLNQFFWFLPFSFWDCVSNWFHCDLVGLPDLDAFLNFTMLHAWVVTMSEVNQLQQCHPICFCCQEGERKRSSTVDSPGKLFICSFTLYCRTFSFWLSVYLFGICLSVIFYLKKFVIFVEPCEVAIAMILQKLKWFDSLQSSDNFFFNSI